MLGIWRCGTGKRRWKNCRVCAAATKAPGELPATSSTGWCASPEPLLTTDIQADLFPSKPVSGGV